LATARREEVMVDFGMALRLKRAEDEIAKVLAPGHGFNSERKTERG
jgi:hypothetical protein